MTREQAIEVLIDRYNSGVIRGRTDDEWRMATDTVIAALREALKRAEGCDTCLKGKAHFGDVLWAINRNGKAVININGEQANTVFYHCPMCGRKLTAPPPSGAIGPETGEKAPNGDEGVRE